MLWLSLDSWNNLMVAFLAIGALATVVVGIATFCVVRLQKDEARRSALEIANANKAAGEANERAANAELALVELRSPRNIDPESFNKALEGVAPSKVEILYSEPCSDCFWLAQWLFNFLGPNGGLGWPITEPKPLVPPTSGPFVGLPPAIAAHANPWGVARGLSHDWKDAKLPATALLRAIADSMGKTPMIGGYLDATMESGTVRIVVAPKT